MEPHEKWWLIREKDIRPAVRLLRGLDIRGGLGFDVHEEIRGVLHDLDTGLHVTDAVPDDWKEDAGEADS